MSKAHTYSSSPVRYDGTHVNAHLCFRWGKGQVPTEWENTVVNGQRRRWSWFCSTAPPSCTCLSLPRYRSFTWNANAGAWLSTAPVMVTHTATRLASRMRTSVVADSASVPCQSMLPTHGNGCHWRAMIHNATRLWLGRCQSPDQCQLAPRSWVSRRHAWKVEPRCAKYASTLPIKLQKAMKREAFLNFKRGCNVSGERRERKEEKVLKWFWTDRYLRTILGKC